jgi:hypothetical protein
MIWKPIKDFEDCYEISSAGQVRSVARIVAHPICKVITLTSKILDTRINNSGYLTVRLSKDGKTFTKFIHILKAQAFIANPGNKNFVNHIDGNKLNNENDNLEWCTHSENIKHAYRLGLMTVSNRQIPLFDKCLGKEFSSLKRASEYYQIPYSTLKNYLNGNRRNKTCLEYLPAQAA